MEHRTGAAPLIARLQNSIKETLATVIPAGPLALVDYPDYSNVGDSAIWLGQSIYLQRERGQRPAYCCSIGSYAADALAESAPTGPILICGGGNFGTLWPRHQEFRIELLERFSERPIIQLPQSIHFSDESSIATTARAIARHGAFAMLVRDQKSYDFAKAKFDCSVHLCPDMAFYIGATPRRASEVDLLYLMRTDGERIGTRDVPDTKESKIVTDWLDESRYALRFVRLMTQARGMLTGQAERRASIYDALARQRYRRGVETLSQGKVVVTDRLHAHIMSLLLDIPHVALDNSYGKLSGFIDAWTADYAGLRRAASMAEALDQARAML
jgi:pyruvyl transferase EpsO